MDLQEMLGVALGTRFGSQVHRSAQSAQWIVVGESAGRTVEIDARGETARIFAGRLIHAMSYEEPDDIQALVGAVSLILEGRGTMFFGLGIDGEFGYLGYELVGDDFIDRTLDEGAVVLTQVAI